MTCIVGYIEKKEKETVIYLGGDSAGVAGTHITLREDPKVFKKTGENGTFLIGFTSSFRMGQLLMSSKFEPPKQKENQTDLDYMITDFVDEVRKVFDKNGYMKKESGQEEGGTFIVAYKDKLYQIESDFQVGVNLAPYDACGSGEDYAKGALYSLVNFSSIKDGKKIVEKALEISANFNAGVSKPFNIVKLIYKNHENKKTK